MKEALGADPEGATPLTEDEQADLIPDHLATRGELDEWEQTNIATAAEWLARRKPIADRVLTVGFAKVLHELMFSHTWKWAGKFRTSERNIGVPWPAIGVRLYEQLQNTQQQLEAAAMPFDEIAARFHHGLVYIHPYPNGNGRHSRLMTDALMRALGQEPFTWGNKPLVPDVDVRTTYLAALRAADSGDIKPLLVFVRS